MVAQRIQALAFSRTESPEDVAEGKGWTKATAAEWAKAHDFKSTTVETEEAFWCRQIDPDKCKVDSYVTMTENFPVGVKAVSCDVEDEAEQASALAPEGTIVAAEPISTKAPLPAITREPPKGPIHRAAALGVEDEENRIVSFVASDETPDRMGDIIRAEGWNLRNFKRNPVLLWAHDSGEPPIGTVMDVKVEGKISPEGAYTGSDDVVPALRQIAADPAKAAMQHGQLTSNCCFCARDLTDPRSVEAGFGPICAEKFGLPYGD